jgi:membrane fusion protein, multidrug efflux system
VEEDLNQVRTRLAKGLIVAPIAGIVSERRANVGDLVGEAGANHPLFHIVDNRLLNLTVTVPSGAMAGLRPGQPLDFTTDAVPGRTFRGKVRFINPAVNETDRSVKVIAEVENTAGELKGGLFVKGRIVTGSRAGTLLAPREALAGWDVLGKKARLFVVTDNRAALRDVRTGLATDAGVEIVSGLKPGETYIVRGAFTVKEGDRLIIAPKQGS